MAPGGGSGQGHADMGMRCGSEVRKGRRWGGVQARGQTGLFTRQRGWGGGLSHKTLQELE